MLTYTIAPLWWPRSQGFGRRIQGGGLRPEVRGDVPPDGKQGRQEDALLPPFDADVHHRSPAGRCGGAVGEERKVAYGPAGLAFGEEVDLEEFAEACVAENFPEGCDPSSTRDEVRERLSAHIQEVVTRNYADLEAGIKGKEISGKVTPTTTA